MQQTWNKLKEGFEVLMNGKEIDQLTEYIGNLSEDEQDIYYRYFASFIDKSLICGILTRCFRCKLKNYNN
jgi:hypothetical protein